MNTIRLYLTLLRPHQYVKNGFVLLPLFFGLRLTDMGSLTRGMMAFAAFCLLASAVYVMNDYMDREEDRLHPGKRARPLANGAVSGREALLLVVLLLLLSLGGTWWWLPGDTVWFLVFYFILNIAYSLRLKRVPLVDVNLIAVGFVIRLYVGSTATGVPLSQWIVLMTFLLALFLALSKRREDVLIFLRTGVQTRQVIGGYNLEFLTAAMVVMAAVVIVSYVMYALSPQVESRVGSHHLYLTVFFVIIGILRYLQIALVENDSGNPTRVLLTDVAIRLAIAGWLTAFLWILY